MPNALAREKSPYLRQHAGNPVEWLPWGEEAFARARDLDRPIFLSIGYSTCHWCHVMARESFEDPAIAALLNERFVPVKVDREERPDVDRVYMAFVQAATGHGGWPLSAWLTPDLKPFYGGTYYPPDDRHGRPGFGGLLEALSKGWTEDRGKFVEAADGALASLRAAGEDGLDSPAEDLHQAGSNAYSEGFRFLERAFDRARGGFGGAPKFPRASNLAFLFRCAALQGPESEEGDAAARMAVGTLKRMARGGIHDHVGGGFHRYSVDAEWFVPHFEKMLYDQAQIALNAIEAWQATGDERHGWLVRDVLEYLLRDLADPAGGFHSAEDADSEAPAGNGGGSRHREGAFYLWTKAEIDAIVGPDSDLFYGHFGVKTGGNVPAERDPQGEFGDGNILSQVRTLTETARLAGLDPEEASNRMAAALDRLRSARAGRPRPGRDDKVVAAWNGLAISAFSRAAAVPSAALADRRGAYRAAALRTADFVRRELWDEGREVLFRCWRGGRSPVEGFAEDYALMVQGLLDLYEAVFDVRWVQWAERLQARMDELFWDKRRGGYFNSAETADVPLRLKEDYDGAEPAASSVAAMNLLRLGGIFGEEAGGWRKRGLEVLEAFRPHWSRQPNALPQMLCALELALLPPRQLVLAGDPDAEDFKALAETAFEQLSPRFTLLAADGGPGQAWLGGRAPWIAAMAPSGGRAAAYYCEGYACRAPVTSPEELRKLVGPVR